MGPTIVVSQKEYRELAEKAWKYEYLRGMWESDLFSPPPTQDAGVVVEAFKKTGKYTDKFLKSLANGLKRSACFS